MRNSNDDVYPARVEFVLALIRLVVALLLASQ
jgi:hypothetical protein